MIAHQPIAIYIALYIYQKKIFVRGVVRGIDFEKSLLERLSPEGGQNWHKLPSHTSYNMPKSNKNTSLAHHSGRKQRLFVKYYLPLGGHFFVPQSSLRRHDWLLIDQLRGRNDKSLCFHPLKHFLYHIQSFEVH